MTGTDGTVTAQLPVPPRPTADDDTAVFWDGVAAGELRLQRCSTCGVLRHPPGPMCARCRSLDWETIVACGEGTIFSRVVAHYPELAGFTYPYVVALVDLAEGVRIVTNIRDAAVDDVAIGAPVELFFEDHGDFRLPQFRLVHR